MDVYDPNFPDPNYTNPFNPADICEDRSGICAGAIVVVMGACTPLGRHDCAVTVLVYSGHLSGQLVTVRGSDLCGPMGVVTDVETLRRLLADRGV